MFGARKPDFLFKFSVGIGAFFIRLSQRFSISLSAHNQLKCGNTSTHFQYDLTVI